MNFPSWQNVGRRNIDGLLGITNIDYKQKYSSRESDNLSSLLDVLMLPL